MNGLKYICLFLVVNNNLLSMNEAKRNSLASPFCVDVFCSNQDINNKHILHHYFVDKKWWYVDQQIQFYHKGDDNIKEKKRNDIDEVYFNRSGTEIIVYPNCIPNICALCVWDRANGKEIDRIDMDTFEQVCKGSDEKWKDRISNRFGCLYFHEDVDIDVCNCLQKYATDQGNFDKNRKKIVLHVDNHTHHKNLDINVAYVWHRKQKKEIFQLVHDGRVYSSVFNQNGKEIITASEDCTMRLWDCKTGQELLRIVYDTEVKSAIFNEQGTEFIVGTDDGKIQVFTQYHPQHLSQILLKKLLHLWVQVEKPSKNINSPEKLLNNVAVLLHCDETELWSAWNLFPENMQNALWLSMYKKIQKYGK